jgi:hypothetical protein
MTNRYDIGDIVTWRHMHHSLRMVMMYMLYVRIPISLLGFGASGTSPRAVLNDDVGMLDLDVPRRLRTARPRRRTRNNRFIFSLNTMLILTRMRLLLRKFAMG